MKSQVLSLKSKVGTGAGRATARGFTMIEIAISLAVIGFALVAIIGILPLGMQTQKTNRQETIINQDVNVFLDAIRSGAQGLDDLTNHVVAISNFCTLNGLHYTNWYTYITPNLPLNSGARIVGLLSTPKYLSSSQGLITNHVVAFVRSVSGPAVEKAPMSPSATPVEDLAFSLGFNYRMISDVVPYFAFAYDTNGLPVPPLPPSGFPPGAPAGAPGVVGRDYAGFSGNLQTNLHDLRLTFRWPLKSDGTAGSGYQVFRAPAAGTLVWTNELNPTNSWPTSPTNISPAAWSTALFFFQPRTYLQVHTP